MVGIMSDRDELKKLSARKFFLNKVSANRFDIEPKNETVDISEETYFEIIENNSEYLSLRVITKIFVEPEALLSIELESQYIKGVRRFSSNSFYEQHRRTVPLCHEIVV